MYPDEEVHRRLDAIEYKLDLVLSYLGVRQEKAEMPEVLDLVRRGRKIEAIKAYRQATGAGLKDARDAVEAMEAGRPPR